MTSWQKRKRKMSRRARGGISLLVLMLTFGLLLPITYPIRIEDIPQLIHKTKATMNEKRHNKELAKRYSAIGYGYTKREQDCLITLWTIESRFDNLAKNPRSTAYGIAQLLGESDSDPRIQILRGLRYIDRRFNGSACSALSWHTRHGWY